MYVRACVCRYVGGSVCVRQNLRLKTEVYLYCTFEADPRDNTDLESLRERERKDKVLKTKRPDGEKYLLKH